MTSRDFCYWLQGYFEINGSGAAAISADAANCIRKHLSLVFVHEIDPSHGPAEHQVKLNEIHSGALDEVKKIAEDAKKTAEQAKQAATGPHHPPVFRC